MWLQLTIDIDGEQWNKIAIKLCLWETSFCFFDIFIFFCHNKMHYT